MFLFSLFGDFIDSVELEVSMLFVRTRDQLGLLEMCGRVYDIDDVRGS